MSEIRIADIHSSSRRGRIRRGGSLLVDETFLMEQQRRAVEQQGHRQFAKVNAKEHFEQQNQAAGPASELQDSVQAHPHLDNPKYDGADLNLAIPQNNPEALDKYNEAKEEQKNDLQHRLGLGQKYSSTPELKR